MSWHEYNIYSKTYTEGSDPFCYLKNLIECYPGITGKSLVEFVGKSRATVMRFIAALKAKGHIEYRGSAKTGGYFIPEKIAHKQSENGILSTVNKSTRNVLALMFSAKALDDPNCEHG